MYTIESTSILQHIKRVAQVMSQSVCRWHCRERVWVHDDCAYWSPQSYSSGGTWWNLAREVRRGRSIKCGLCDDKGATIGCRLQKCRLSYHLPCARTTGWDGDDTAVGEFYCPKHRPAALRAQQVSCRWFVSRFCIFPVSHQAVMPPAMRANYVVARG